MAIKSSTLRPGLLVSLKTSCIGNVSYDRRDLEIEHTTEDGKKKAKWETERTVTDPDEHEKALKVQSAAGSLIRRVCAKSAHGLLCPQADADKLERAMVEARALCDEFNLTAGLTEVRVNIMVGRIAADDVEAVKSINAEVRDLMARMQRGIAEVDVKLIREAASDAKQLGSMLSPDAAARVQLAVDSARTAARQIVKAGETAAKEIDQSAIRTITEARTAFLDMDEQKEIRQPEVVANALDLEARERAIDLGTPLARVGG